MQQFTASGALGATFPNAATTLRVEAENKLNEEFAIVPDRPSAADIVLVHNPLSKSVGQKTVVS